MRRYLPTVALLFGCTTATPSELDMRLAKLETEPAQLDAGGSLDEAEAESDWVLEYTHCLRPTEAFMEVAGEQGLRLVEAAFLGWGPYRVEFSDSCEIWLDSFDTNGRMGMWVTPEDVEGTMFPPFLAIDSERSYWVNGPYYENSYDLHTIIQHEVGHFLGLEHDERINRLMSDTVRPGDVRCISGEDRARLEGQ
jgi:hypothetical protein